MAESAFVQCALVDLGEYHFPSQCFCYINFSGALRTLGYCVNIQFVFSYLLSDEKLISDYILKVNRA
jgi:hypothetical protein